MKWIPSLPVSMGDTNVPAGRQLGWRAGLAHTAAALSPLHRSLKQANKQQLHRLHRYPCVVERMVPVGINVRWHQQQLFVEAEAWVRSAS